MKEMKGVKYSLAGAGVLIILLCLTACEGTEYDLLDPESAGVWTLYNSSNSALPGNKIWDMAVDRQGDLWVTCYGNGLARYSSGTWITYSTANSQILSNSVTAVEATNDGSIIIGTSNGVTVRNAAGVWSSYKDPAVTTMDINSVKVTADGLLWVGTEGEGFYIADASGYEKVTLSGIESVNAIEEDTKDNVWLGTNNGLIKWDGTNLTQYTTADGLPDNDISALFFDSKQKLWIGTFGSKVVSWLDNSGIHTLSLLNGIEGNVVWDICEDKKGDIWFATYTDGVIRYDGVVPHSYKEYNAFYEDNVNCITKDNDGNMWFGLASKGLVKYTLPLH
jgi:ligand-binding sensor domain-containing protein